VADQLNLAGGLEPLPEPTSAPLAPEEEAARLFAWPESIRGQQALEPRGLALADLRGAACPTCGAAIGRPCKRPSGHAVFGGDVHAPRRRLAEEASR
jgi:hypothetical protein